MNGRPADQRVAWINDDCIRGLEPGYNHHAAPTSARFALAPGEIDPGWWVTRALIRCRQATVRHDEVKLKQVA